MDRFYGEDPEKEKPFFESEYNDDDDDDDEYDLDELEEEAIAFIQNQNADMLDMQVEIALNELKHDLLDKAIKIAENKWFWRFKSAATKITDIALIYHSLLIITEDPEDK